MALSADEILSYFSLTEPNPFKKRPESYDSLTAPGRGNHYYKTKEQERRRSESERGCAVGVRRGEERRINGRGYEDDQQRLHAVPGFGEPVYNLSKMEDIDVGEDYLAELSLQQDYDNQTGFGVAGDEAELYKRYSFSIDRTPRLPVTEMREEVVRTIESNQVTIIQGVTGSGKSTLVPQYILQHYARLRRRCNIVCTQPRRIATRTIAQYIASCRDWKLGSIVGYHIYNDKVLSEDTRLTFVTTGVLLEKLIGSANMNEYTHVILDEVHERNLETDFCLLLVRKLLRTNSSRVKVVLMSATLESRQYSQYFGVRKPGDEVPRPAPVLSVNGLMFPVMEFYLDDLRQFGEVERLPTDNPRVTLTQRQMCKALIIHFDQLERESADYARGDFFRGTVLCFLPGMPDIRDMESLLKLDNFASNNRLCLIPLHSMISTEEQYKAFLHPEHGQRKVILATNIAESSITVPDIKYVVDFCMVKQLLTDQETGFDRLVTTWASKAALKQRKGRAGRVREGRCYRLTTREYFRKYCPSYSVPEMQRRSIEHPVLKTKKLNMGEPTKILSLALQPPSALDIEKAVTNLKELGALTVTCGGVVNPIDGDLTFVGSVLEALPISARLGKLLLLGHVFNCLEEAIVIAAALGQRSIFERSFSNEIKSYRSKMGWMDRTESDCIATLFAYKEWILLKKSDSFAVRHEHMWCSDNWLNLHALREVADTVRDLSLRLARFSIHTTRDLALVQHTKSDLLILKVVLCGAFYPNYFKWGIGDEELNRRLFCGHNHCTTVMVAGLPPNATKYAPDLCRMFSGCIDKGGPFGKALHFDGSKLFVEFEHGPKSKDGGVVLDSVILALKKRHLRDQMVLYLEENVVEEMMKRERQRKEEEEEDEKKGKDGSFGANFAVIKPAELPRSGILDIEVTDIICVGHFWAQRCDRDTSLAMQSIAESISHRILRPLGGNIAQLQGTFCLAMYSRDGAYYRARIDHIDLHKNLATVTFVDYGNKEVVPVSNLTKLIPAECELPAQAMECHLTCIRPAASFSSEGSSWVTHANARFIELVQKRLKAKVFSKVEDTLRVELYVPGKTTINEQLVREGYATNCEEPYLSKMEFYQVQAEEKAAKTASNSQAHIDLEQGEEEGKGREPNPVPLTPSYHMMNWVLSYPRRDRTQTTSSSRKITLKGPSSPYEVSFYGMTNVGALRPTNVEKDSVNSVVVDPEPQNTHDKMMVAATVALSPSGMATLARETTLMPSIHGLPHLLCLLFAPSAEMRSDAKKRRYVGAICGLGYHPITGESLHHDHDMELVFDTLITQEDLALVNCIRSCMNIMLSTEPGEGTAVSWGKAAVRKIQREARSKLLELLRKEREMVNRYSNPRRGWNQVLPGDILLPQQPLSGATPGEAEEPDILVPFPLLSGIALSGLRPTEVRGHARISIGELKEAMRELHAKASKSEIPETTICVLCDPEGLVFSTPKDLLDHIHSREHMSRERRLHNSTAAPGLINELQTKTVKLTVQ